jgi:ribosome-binding protein aMBF1 (putative translation factor)
MVVGRGTGKPEPRPLPFFILKESIFMLSGLEIKVARMKVGLKAYELASRVGINADKMSKIEIGRLVPDEKLLSRILEAINEAKDRTQAK